MELRILADQLCSEGGRIVSNGRRANGPGLNVCGSRLRYLGDEECAEQSCESW